jgi:hypothetical protein
LQLVDNRWFVDFYTFILLHMICKQREYVQALKNIAFMPWLEFLLGLHCPQENRNMPNLNPKEVADWFREQAKKCQDQAKQFEEMAIMAEKANMLLHWGTEPGPASPLSPGTITAEQLEARIRRKGARIKQIASEFNVPSKTIKALLEDPAGKVYEGERGWLKIREQANH